MFSINSVITKEIMIDEVAKDLGLGISEEHDNAVLYSVMRIFLKRKAKKLCVDVDCLTIGFDEDAKTIDLMMELDNGDHQDIVCMESITV